MALLPLAVAAGSALYQGYRQSQADRYNAAVMAGEQSSALAQGVEAENLQRRAGREALGRQTAAFGSAGVGYGGSSETALKQSAINQELDALTTRYRAAFTAYGYGAQSKLLSQEANEDQISGVLLAGSRALAGMSGSYYQPASATLGG